MIAPKAEIPTWATPPDTLPAPRVISPACFANVSREPLLVLRTLPRSLCLARSTICGKSWLKSCTAPLTACTITSATAAMTTMIASTSSVEHTRRLQPSRRSIAVATGERTATPKTETKMTSRTLLIDASDAPTATTSATNRIVRIEIETPTSRRLPSSTSSPPEPLSARGSPPDRRGGACRAAATDRVCRVLPRPSGASDPAVSRSGTSRSRQLRPNATTITAAAVRKTG